MTHIQIIHTLFRFHGCLIARHILVPSYSENFNMSEILTLADLKTLNGIPHCVSNARPKKYSIDELESQLDTRNKAIYVGGFIQIKTIDLFI